MIFNVPDEIAFEVRDDMVKFTFSDFSTGWMSVDDSFSKRIDKSNLNPIFLDKHIIKEIEVRNVLDDGINLLKAEKYGKAIEKFDEVLFYDPEYGEALIKKSFALRGQRHFVKALRHYKKAVNADDGLTDIEYHKSLLLEANNERSNFPKLKLNIYAGDEHFAKGEFENAVESYERALANPSRFKDRILSKLLNKKATALLKLDEFEKARECFADSLEVGMNDYAVFGESVCCYNMGLDVSDRFCNLLDITKTQMLTQILILNDLGHFSQSLKISDYLWENHFRVDDFYMNLADARKLTMEKLEMDTSELKQFTD